MPGTIQIPNAIARSGDPLHRRRSVVTQSNLFEGIEAVTGDIDDVFNEQPPIFRSGGVVGHHHCVLLRWELVERDNGRLAEHPEMNTLLLSPQGASLGDYQFVLGIEFEDQWPRANSDHDRDPSGYHLVLASTIRAIRDGLPSQLSALYSCRRGFRPL